MCEIKLSNGTIVSPEDAECIYRIVDRNYHKQDVINKLRENYSDDIADKIEEDDDLLDTIAERFESGLDKNDSYFESMWGTMDNILDDVVSELENDNGE